VDIKYLTISQIQERVDRKGGPDLELLKAMSVDHRAGVQAVYRRYMDARQKEEANARRLREMLLFERSLVEPGHRLVAGVDEAGRGPLAGPVVAAAVILPAGFLPEGLDDSKKLAPARREKLCADIKKKALAWAIGMATVAEIETYNIHHASMMAMRRAVNSLRLKPDMVLIDGRFALEGVVAEQRTVVGGDGLCPSISAASILATGTRDRLMDVLHLLYPEYGFDRHRGYGTPAHLAAIAMHGPSPVPRRGVMPV